MAVFALRPNSKFSTNLNQAINDTTTATWNVNAVPARIPCVLIAEPGTSNQEKVKVTATPGSGQITVTRNFDGKGAFTHGFNAVIVDYDSPEYITTLADLVEQNFNSDYTPALAQIVTPAGTQTLTNKTIGDTLNMTTGAITQTGAAAHITLTPGASKLVKIATLRQDTAANAYFNNSVMLIGQTKKTGDTTDNMTQAITFGITFTNVPIVICTAAGGAATAATWPAASGVGWFSVEAVNNSTTGFTANMSRNQQGTAETSRSFANTTDYFFTWMAIGTF